MKLLGQHVVNSKVSEAPLGIAVLLMYARWPTTGDSLRFTYEVTVLNFFSRLGSKQPLPFISSRSSGVLEPLLVERLEDSQL